LQLQTPSLPYLLMRFSGWLAIFLGTAGLCLGQTIDVRPTVTPPPALPEFRPALVGRGPGALINQMDEQALFKDGLKNAAVLFACTVTKTGSIAGLSKFRSTPDSAALEGELRKKLAIVSFIPAIYKGAPVDAVFFGTVSFMIVNDKPRLRIFSNQETKDLRAEDDFIAPQLVIGADSSFTGWHYPARNIAPVEVDGAVSAEVDVDEKGLLNHITIKAEEPPYLGFGPQVSDDLQGARFIPGFRGGKPVASKSTLTVFFTKSEDVFKVPSVGNLGQ
jgi:hypothetical protein